MLRTIPCLLLALFAIVAVAQTTIDFTARYGNPDAEKFLVRLEITLTAKYAEDHAACEMLIEPRHTGEAPSTKEQSMLTATVSEIIDELIPRWQRGVLLDHSIEHMGGSEHQVFEYQNVTISRNFVRYLPANHDKTSAIIVRKDIVCRSSRLSENFVPSVELTASDLHVRYGDPVTQRFNIRPDIKLTVTYSQDQVPCELAVGPTRSIIPRDEATKYMRSEVANDIVNELVPEDRGNVLFRTVTMSGCNQIETNNYQNAIISRFRHNCDLPKPEIEGTAAIMRKNPSCATAFK